MADKEELVLDLLARNKMGQGTAGAAKDLEKVGTAADAAGKKTKEMGTAAKAAERHTDMLGDTSAGAARKIDRLDDNIKKVNQDLVFLAAQLADADDAAGRLDISKGIRKSQADLKRLTSAKGVLAGLLPDPAPAAQSFMQKFGAGIVDAGASVSKLAGNQLGVTIGASVGAAAAPVILPAIASALSAGAGLGVIGAGVALAVKNDPNIKKAGAEAGKRFMGELAIGARVFSGPVLESIGVLDKAGDRIATKWNVAFSELAGSVVPFTEDIVTGVERVSDAFTNVASESAPAIAGIGDAWKLIADGVGDAVESMADGSKEAAGNMVLLGGVLGSVVRGTGDLIGKFNELSGNPWVSGSLVANLKDKYQETADASGKFAWRTQGLTKAQSDAAGAAQAHRDSLSKLSRQMLATTDPAFALLNAQDRVRESQKALNDAQDKYGRKSKEARQATRDLATAALELQGRAGALGTTFDGNLSPAMRATFKSAGLTKGEIRAVEREMRRAKAAGDAYARNYKATATLTTVYVTRYKEYGLKSPSPSGGFQGRASGGPVQKDTPYLVGEEGPEIMVPEAVGRVLTAAATRNIMRGGHRTAVAPASGGGGIPSAGIVGRIELVGPEEFRVFFRKMVRSFQILPDVTTPAVSA